MQIEKGSAKTDYTPYVGTSYPVTFTDQGTVYDCTFDWVSGKLTVTHLKVVLDGVNNKLTLANSNNQYTNTFIWGGYSSIGIKDALFVCDCAKQIPPAVSSLNDNVWQIWCSTSAPRMWISVPKTIASNSDMDTYLQSNNIAVVYPLATPQEYTLTATQVQTLLGLNNIWSDGSVEIEYADPFNVENPTFFDARPLFEITNPAANDVLSVNSIDVTFTTGYTGTVTIDCETMNCNAGLTNTNYLISATDFPVLSEGVNIVTWSGSGSCKMVPRWWEL